MAGFLIGMAASGLFNKSFGQKSPVSDDSSFDVVETTTRVKKKKFKGAKGKQYKSPLGFGNFSNIGY